MHVDNMVLRNALRRQETTRTWEGITIHTTYDGDDDTGIWGNPWYCINLTLQVGVVTIAHPRSEVGRGLGS